MHHYPAELRLGGVQLVLDALGDRVGLNERDAGRLGDVQRGGDVTGDVVDNDAVARARPVSFEGHT